MLFLVFASYPEPFFPLSSVAEALFALSFPFLSERFFFVMLGPRLFSSLFQEFAIITCHRGCYFLSAHVRKKTLDFIGEVSKFLVGSWHAFTVLTQCCFAVFYVSKSSRRVLGSIG